MKKFLSAEQEALKTETDTFSNRHDEAQRNFQEIKKNLTREQHALQEVTERKKQLLEKEL